jgi:ParB family chromosome partitioning protein
MKLDFLPLTALQPSRANMRGGRRAPDVADIMPSIRARGILVPLLVRPVAGGAGEGTAFEIVVGRRRYEAARIVADEAGEGASLPCAILTEGDDADAVEASIIENVARLDPDEVTRWEAFVHLVREERTADQIAATFGLPELAVRRPLALGNPLPRIRDLYRREAIDAATIRHLTLAGKGRQREWLALHADPEAYNDRGGVGCVDRHARFV